MKKIKSLFTSISLFTVIIVTGVAIWNVNPTSTRLENSHQYPTNKYGAFLAAQHAIYVNDFEKAAEFSKNLPDKDINIIRNTIVLTDFLNGKIPESANLLADETGSASQLIYDAYLIKNNDWAAVYKRHKNDESALASPLRIWSGVAIGKSDEVIKFIGELKTTESWKSFVRGQIYAKNNQIDNAAEQFAKVSVDFMNINDYLYVMAFYNHNKMDTAASTLYNSFTERPGGMYMLDMDTTSDWSKYSGINNSLAFNLIQNVSHTQVMMYSDLSLIMLRFAEIVQKNTNSEKDALNYYIGQYFLNNGGDCEKYFRAINKKSPFYSFAMMKIAEKTGKIYELEKAINVNPLFVPAIVKLVARNVQQGNEKKALNIVNRALKNDNLTETGRAFFLKTRAHIYFTFNDIESAQSDLRSAADILPMDAGILAIQSKIWSVQKRELDTAYEYAIALVTKNPTDIESWDILGMVVNAKEGPTAALEVIEKVAQISETCSSLFEHLGDLQAQLGNKNLARDSYLRAIDLSGDGLTIVPHLEKKIRKLK
ncbi:MAG: hypothetical protein JW974_03665 [Alphaproteobacteria bacterium]|nr:hypothetical protein [Alphaproteobacteria bacterium]MBN2675335.1 hypothetical protein [Alphaproteobacteria bacterium]